MPFITFITIIITCRLAGRPPQKEPFPFKFFFQICSFSLLCEQRSFRLAGRPPPKEAFPFKFFLQYAHFRSSVKRGPSGWRAGRLKRKRFLLNSLKKMCSFSFSSCGKVLPAGWPAASKGIASSSHSFKNVLGRFLLHFCYILLESAAAIMWDHALRVAWCCAEQTNSTKGPARVLGSSMALHVVPSMADPVRKSSAETQAYTYQQHM